MTLKREDFGYTNLIMALDNMRATFLVCDENYKVVYYNHLVCDALNISEDVLRGANLQDLAAQKYITNSASLHAFKSGKTSIRYVQGRMAIPILTVSEPVFDKNGKLVYVVAFSINEKLTEEIFQEMAHSRLQSADLLNFFSNKISDQEEIIAESQPIRDILKSLSKAASMESTILLTGETGVGKEVIAKFIHNNSPRPKELFIPVNCAAIPENLVESELFGYVAGAFSGASKNGKAGVFELADGGKLCFWMKLENCPCQYKLRFYESLKREFVPV